MSDFPYSNEELTERAKKLGARDGKHSSDDIEGLDDGELEDIGDDAWNHSGWMEFENDPALDEHQDRFATLASELRLSSIYIDTFVEGIKAREPIAPRS